MELDLKNVPKLVGKKAREQFDDCLTLLSSVKWPLFFVGPSGSGKTIMAMNLAKAYSRMNKVPAYHIQLSPDQTKTSVILGLRLVNGSLKPVKGVIAEAMQKGGIVVVDEASHASQELLLMFNSVLDRTSITSIGDEIVVAKPSFRVVFTSNDSTYAGNVKLPQSFAQRLFVYTFDYVSASDELKIASKVSKDEFSGSLDVPESVRKYIVWFMREIRSKEFPLSPRNMAIAFIRLSSMKKNSVDDIYKFGAGANTESVLRNIFKAITGRDAQSSIDLRSQQMQEFLEYTGKIGHEQFRKAILSSCMYYLDVDGIDVKNDALKNNISAKLI